MNNRAALALIVAALNFVSCASADDSGIYLSAGVGSAEHSRSSVLITPNNPVLSGNSSAREMSWSAAIGYRVSSALAFEIGYLDLGTIDAMLTDATGNTNSNGHSSFSAEGVTTAMLGRFPIGKWTPYLKAGVLFSKTDLRFSGTARGRPFNFEVKGTDEDAFFGAGATYDFNTRWAAQFDFIQINDTGKRGSGESTYSNLMLDVLWKF